MGMLTLTSRGSGFTSSPITLTNPTFSRIFIITVCWTFIKGFLLIYFNDHVTFKSIYVVYYIYWLVCIEPSLHFRAWENISPSSNAAASCCRLPKFPHTGHHLPQSPTWRDKNDRRDTKTSSRSFHSFLHFTCNFFFFFFYLGQGLYLYSSGNWRHLTPHHLIQSESHMLQARAQVGHR
jgi:hypothetical protein